MVEKIRKEQYRELVLVAVPASGERYKATHADIPNYAIFVGVDGESCQYLAPPSKGLLDLCERDGILPRRLAPQDCPLKLERAHGKWGTVTDKGGQFVVESNDTLRPRE